jgi:hypothetical protein
MWKYVVFSLCSKAYVLIRTSNYYNITLYITFHFCNHIRSFIKIFFFSILVSIILIITGELNK